MSVQQCVGLGMHCFSNAETCETDAECCSGNGNVGTCSA